MRVTLMGEVYLVGTLTIGDHAAAYTGPNTVILGKVISVGAMVGSTATTYEVATPHGSIISIGSAHVKPPSEKELALIKKYEEDVIRKGESLYGGNLKTVKKQ